MLYKNTIQNISGEYVSEDTPVPIPNTAVKLEIAENSMGMPHVKIGFCQIFFMPKKIYMDIYIKSR